MERLKAFPGFHGVAVVGPDDGEMACGEYGPGRMAEPAAILQAIEGLLAGAAVLALALSGCAQVGYLAQAAGGLMDEVRA